LAGETLSSIAAANGLSTESVAAFNGISAETYVIEGQTIQVPSAEEAGVTSTVAAPTSGSHLVVGGESLSSVAAANGITVADLAAANGMAADAYLIEGTSITIPASTGAVVPAGMGSVSSPSGDVPLDPAAAESFNAMRSDSLNNFGVDLYPAGPVSGYRTYEEQTELYNLYLSGQGAPANPPGTSSHEYGAAVDLAEPAMRDVVDQIGYAYGWVGNIPSEWWHIAHNP
jgi:LysM repeat protein